MASADGRPSESLKRSRVTFAESSTAGVGSGAGAGDGEPSRKRRAAEQHNDTSSTGAGTAGRIRQGAYDEFDDDDQADGGMRYAEVEQEEASGEKTACLLAQLASLGSHLMSFGCRQ